MTTLTKFADNMRGVNSKLSDLKAVTADLSLAEKRALLESLTDDIQAAAVDGPKKRLAAVSAAATSTNQRTKEAYKHAVKGLQRLGLAIDAICASGDVSQLDTKMKELKWNSEQRIGLKTALAIVGAIA
jgi:hypothetical protein